MKRQGLFKDIHISWDYCPLQGTVAFLRNDQNTERRLRFLLGMYVLAHN